MIPYHSPFSCVKTIESHSPLVDFPFPPQVLVMVLYLPPPFLFMSPRHFMSDQVRSIRGLVQLFSLYLYLPFPHWRTSFYSWPFFSPICRWTAPPLLVLFLLNDELPFFFPQQFCALLPVIFFLSFPNNSSFVFYLRLNPPTPQYRTSNSEKCSVVLTSSTRVIPPPPPSLCSFPSLLSSPFLSTSSPFLLQITDFYVFLCLPFPQTLPLSFDPMSPPFFTCGGFFFNLTPPPASYF